MIWFFKDDGFVCGEIDAVADEYNIDRHLIMQEINQMSYQNEMKKSSRDGKRTPQGMTQEGQAPMDFSGWEVPLLSLPPDVLELNVENHGSLFTRPQMDDMDYHVMKVRGILSTQSLQLYLYTRPEGR